MSAATARPCGRTPAATGWCSRRRPARHAPRGRATAPRRAAPRSPARVSVASPAARIWATMPLAVGRLCGGEQHGAGAGLQDREMRAERHGIAHRQRRIDLQHHQHVQAIEHHQMAALVGVGGELAHHRAARFRPAGSPAGACGRARTASATAGSGRHWCARDSRGVSRRCRMR